MQGLIITFTVIYIVFSIISLRYGFFKTEWQSFDEISNASDNSVNPFLFENKKTTGLFENKKTTGTPLIQTFQLGDDKIDQIFWNGNTEAENGEFAAQKADQSGTFVVYSPEQIIQKRSGSNQWHANSGID